ncbi:MAG: hypothetical protein Q8Q28_12615 [Pseudomonadota bacterium]|nr:hypothetical protein [Pseudomonadota bacterium]
MKQLEYSVRFNTPAFLGNAEQQAQWRTPPFKALIRQWWRVVKAKDFGYDHRRVREAEMRLFGAASDSGQEKSHRSLVRLRLDGWEYGKQNTVESGAAIHHPEVPAKKDRYGNLVLDSNGKEIHEIGANLYLGYGPVEPNRRNAIAPGDPSNKLTVLCPDSNADEIRAAMQLAAWFGTLGSRARNGWGALHIEGEAIKGFADLNIPALSGLIAPRPLDDCLKVEWLHALGSDAGGIPLVWRLLKVDKEKRQLVPFATWQEVMRELARIKIVFRTSDFFKFVGGGRDGHADPQHRHILAYPAGSQHNVTAWGNNGRLANQVLFKVHQRGNGYAATIAHFPSRMPVHMATRQQLPDQGAVWKEVHRLLDAEKTNGLSRIKGAQA